MIDPARFPDLLEAVGALAHQAGDAILATVTTLGEVEEKEDGSPVTRADRAANDVLVEGLQALDPNLPIISEEGDLDESVRSSGAAFWLVDPLDGTKEFIAGRPEYTVNVALVEDATPVLGEGQIAGVLESFERWEVVEDLSTVTDLLGGGHRQLGRRAYESTTDPAPG